MTNAGRLKGLFLFQRRGTGDDGFGNTTANGEWETIFRAAARVIPLKGGETVINARLSGTQPVILQIRYSQDAASMDTTWRAVNERNPVEVYDITAIADFDQANRQLDVAAIRGVAI